MKERAYNTIIPMILGIMIGAFFAILVTGIQKFEVYTNLCPIALESVTDSVAFFEQHPPCWVVYTRRDL